MNHPGVKMGCQRFSQAQHGATYYDPARKVHRGQLLKLGEVAIGWVGGMYLTSPFREADNPSGRAYQVFINSVYAVPVTEEQVLVLLGE